MPRPIWSGTLSFGLLHVPIQLMPCERDNELKFRMLDGRDHAPIRFERLNGDTGQKVEWSDIVKAYEYEKGSFVVVEDADLKAAAAERSEAVELEAFVDAKDVSPAYCDKPYVLVPGKKAEKGYVLLRETLKRTGKVGIGRVVLRTKEHLAMVMQQDRALVLVLLRFPEDLTPLSEYVLPEDALERYRVSEKEIDMAEQLIGSMVAKWNPDDFHDEFRARLMETIERRVAQKGLVSATKPHDEGALAHPATNVVDFMALLKESLESKKKGAKAKPSTEKTVAKPGPAKTTAKHAAAKGATKAASTKKRKAS